MSNSMINWRAKQIRSANKRSETPGKSKGATCQTDPMKKFYFSSPKAYKDPNYMEWHMKARAMNHGKQK